MIACHQDVITGMFLDQVNRVLYTVGADGFLNIIDPLKGVLIDTLQLQVEISSLTADVQNKRLFLAHVEGNVDVYEYDHRAKVKYKHSICTPGNGPIKSLWYDDVKKYLFAGGYDNGDVWIFEVGKPGH